MVLGQSIAELLETARSVIKVERQAASLPLIK
jgi:hypothetical protein